MKIDNKLILENSKSLNVLYVEDDDVLRKVTLKLLSNYFNNVDFAVDGADGLAKYIDYEKEHSTYYDIVFSDINMPNMDGFDMTRHIKNIYIKQVIIFITAFNDVQNLHEAIDIGVNGFLTKPMEAKQLKNVLYTTTQIISDRKLVQKYYEQIEYENMLQIDLKDSSLFKSSKDILQDLEKNKEKISHLWVKSKILQERLESYQIDVEYFRSHYGIKVIEYFLNVIKGKAELGNCPVVFVMLEFFKNKNLALEDIFMICVHFKNSVTSYIFAKYSFNQEVFDDVSYILDRNFEGVVINYLKNKEKNTFEIAVPVVQIKETSKEEIKEEVFDYIDYVLEADMYELQDLEEDIDSLAISVTMKNGASVENLLTLGNQVKRYGTILNNYPLFSNLGEYIGKLGDNLYLNAQVLFEDEQRMVNITALLEGFVNDLIVWRKEIFENNIKNPHFLDSSFFSNVDTIIMFIEYDESAENSDDGDMEFF